MADSKLTALSADATPTSDDLVYIVDDVGGTPTSKKATAANVITKAHGLSDSTVVGVASGVLTSGTDVAIADGGTGASTAAAAFSNLKQAASDTATGVVELATTAETTTGTDATRAVTPDGLHDMTSLAGAAWFIDEDNMASDLDTKTPSQQSVKAYADAKVSDTAYAGSWNGVTTIAPSKNAIYDNLNTNGKGFVNHGSSAGTARPVGFASVTWVGTVEPSNATNDDEWIDVS